MEKGNPGKKVLVIEDEVESAERLVNILGMKGYSAVAAHDGLSGIRLAHKEEVDLIILDLGLPGGNGFFVLDNLNRSMFTSEIPVIIVTANPSAEMEEKAYRMGVADYIHKPCSPEELLDSVKEIIDHNPQEE